MLAATLAEQPQRERVREQCERGHHDDEAAGHVRGLAQPSDRLDRDDDTDPEENDRVN